MNSILGSRSNTTCVWVLGTHEKYPSCSILSCPQLTARGRHLENAYVYFHAAQGTRDDNCYGTSVISYNAKATSAFKFTSLVTAHQVKQTPAFFGCFDKFIEKYTRHLIYAE